MANPIPYSRQWISENDIKAVVDVLRGDFLTTGPLVGRFEEELATSADASHAVAMNSGTSALHAAYAAAGVGPGDEVVTSPLTFAASANAARMMGADVRLVDVEPDTGNMDPAKLESALTSRTKLIVPVDYAGHPAEYDPILEIARSRKIPVVADAAHSFGGAYKKRPVGTLGDMTEISFHPVKPITTAEGGAVLTENAEYARFMRRFRSHGMERDPARMENPEGPWSMEMHDLGYNYRLTDLQCALGLSQLGRLREFISARDRIARRYLKELADVSGLILPTVREHVRHAWHLFVVRVDGPASTASERRLTLFQRLRDAGLGVQVHYLPVHLHPYYRRLGFQKGQFPVAEEFYSRAVSIPLYPLMSESEIAKVLDAVKKNARDL